jgi:uncharacterized membrane protein HdeD (DUF308 family)
MTGTPIHGGSFDAAWQQPAPTPVVQESVTFPFWEILGLGMATVLFGIAVLAWPDATVRVLAVLLGLWLMAAGVVRILGAFLSGRTAGRLLLSGIVGVLFLIGGVACLRDVTKGAVVLAFLVALAWIFTGLAELVVALSATGALRAWLAVLALVSIAIGFVFMLWPGLSLATLVIMVGVSGLVIGTAEIVFAFQLRRARSVP